MATLSEIARAAGVPKSAVSYVLRGRAAEGRIGAERAAHILAVAERLGYRPNAGARAISTGRFAAISLLYRRSIEELPMQLVNTLCQELEAREHHLTLSQISQQQFEQGQLLPRSLRELCVDGMLAYCQLDIPAPAVALLQQLRVPTVWLNAATGADCVHPDDRGAMLDATRRLLELGHRRIGYLEFSLVARDGAPGHYSGADRRAGYEAALREAGLRPRYLGAEYRRKQAAREWPEDDRIARCRAFLGAKDRPSAVIAINPPAVEPLLVAALSLGLELPRDLSLIGLHNRRLKTLGLPVSTLLVPHAGMAREGVAALLRKIAEPEVVLGDVAVPYEAVEEGTLAPPLP